MGGVCSVILKLRNPKNLSVAYSDDMGTYSNYARSQTICAGLKIISGVLFFSLPST